MSHEHVAVVIAAWNAEATIATAIHSALAQAEVAEVVVVDDCSSDRTVQAARASCDGTARLKVFAQTENLGPSQARNRAISLSKSPLIAVLDADDQFLPGRFARLLGVEGWDAIADNVGFVHENAVKGFSIADCDAESGQTECLTLETFVQANVSVRRRPRAELGFLKPVMRRKFLLLHGLRYDPSMRLGEDYALYARMLAAGARFLIDRRCGYLAVQRKSSLSGQHTAEDLAALAASDAELLEHQMPQPARRAVQAHRASVVRKHAHRRFLDAKAQRGFVRAVIDAAKKPGLIADIALDIAADKVARAPVETKEVRYLLG